MVTASAPGFASVTERVEVPSVEPLSLTLSPAPIVEQVKVVSASRQKELRDSLNTRVDVITRNRIDETGGHETVGEILRELPGVVTRRGSETAGAAGEQIQAIDSRQVLVLIDGQPMVGARGIKRGGVLNLYMPLRRRRPFGKGGRARWKGAHAESACSIQCFGVRSATWHVLPKTRYGFSGLAGFLGGAAGVS
jgi:hypothetical protein